MMWNLTIGKNIECAIEAILFSLGEAVEIERLAEALEVTEAEIRKAFDSMKKNYESNKRGINLIEIDGSLQMCSNPEYFDYIQKVTQTKKQMGLSSAALETLSIIAYNQPVTKGTMDFIRGVDCTYSVAKLLERGFIDELGRAETPGRPILYGTTMEFLRCFGLKSLEDLPPLPEKQIAEDMEGIPQKADVIEEFIAESQLQTENNDTEKIEKTESDE